MVSWNAPASNGGAAITAYTATSSPGAFTCTTATTNCTVTGLTNGTSYTFTVTATNPAGTGPASGASAAAVPATVPGAPTGVTGTSNANTQSVVSWTAPASNGGAAISSYTVTLLARRPDLLDRRDHLHRDRPHQRHQLHVHRDRHQLGRHQRRLQRLTGRHAGHGARCPHRR